MTKRIAVAIEEKNESNYYVAEHFGRCTKFMVYEIDGDEIKKTESYVNPLGGHQGGTCQLPAYVNQYNVHTVIAGGMGQKAVEKFHQFSIEVITAPGMECKDALQSYLKGEVKGYEACTHHGHH